MVPRRGDRYKTEYTEGACVGVLNEKFNTRKLCSIKYPKNEL